MHTRDVSAEPQRWTLLSNHGQALVCLSREPTLRLREVADQLGVTERTAFGLVHDLCDAGMLRLRKDGRRNHYEVADFGSGEPLSVRLAALARHSGGAG